MKIFKKILHIGFSAFLIWQTIMLVNRILANQQNDFWDKLLDSIYLNIFVTGIFTIVYSFPIYRLLPQQYYRISNSKILKSIGKIIHIELFKKLLLRTIWRKNQNTKYYFTGVRNGFEDFEINTMKAEFGHFLGFCIVLMFTILIGSKGNIDIALMMFIVNIIFNFYPVILQRFHRLRLDELKNKIRVLNTQYN